MFKEINNREIHILLVDDDPNVRNLFVKVLQRENYSVDEASDGAIAIKKMQQRDYDLIITDLNMPRHDGMDVLTAAKDKDENIQVLILTGHGTVPTAVQAMKVGAYEYLTKPINNDALLLKVRNALERRRFLLLLQEQQKKIFRFHQTIESDLSLARQVQASLVPKLTETDKIAVAVEYLPMIGLGGDFADIYDDQNGRIYLTIIDVTGHGISAALIVNRICSELRKFVREQLTPRDVLYHLNNFYFKSFSKIGMFLTLFSLEIDLNQKVLYYAGSAHPAGLLYRSKNKAFTRLDSQNQIIGFQDADQEKFYQDSIQLESGDRIIFYTDGIVETENWLSEPFGLNGLKKTLKSCGNVSARETALAVVSDVKEYAETELRDDVMIVIADIK